MSYENCFSCSFFRSNPEGCICSDLEKDCKQYKKEILKGNRRMRELSALAKSLWITVISWSALVGMFLSVIALNILHAIIIRFVIFAIWLFNMAIVIYLIIRDEYRIYKKNKQKRRD